MGLMPRRHHVVRRSDVACSTTVCGAHLRGVCVCGGGGGGGGAALCKGEMAVVTDRIWYSDCTSHCDYLAVSCAFILSFLAVHESHES